MKERIRRLEAQGISRARYNELKWICRQYDAYKHAEYLFLIGVKDRPETGNTAWKGPSDPTAAEAVHLAQGCAASSRIKAIEDAARAASPSLAVYILQNVTRGTPWESMPVPCGRNQFYDARCDFFVELNLRV